ncbi:UDP-N-acetylmuramate--L-alanine ligase [Acetobacteraceae bacterium]|nr:UDP-N-acetylmuramate--L-alanine ligase [Acetobacteraceae bacterium]
MTSLFSSSNQTDSSQLFGRPSLPFSVGILHFVGIGGIGMSGIAEAFHLLGYQVQGSDQKENANTQRLQKLGISVFIGHKEEHVENADVIVVSTAIPLDNPEIKKARTRLLPIVRRAEMLAELMRLRWSIAVGGTHGKTTTTSLIASVLEEGNLDPTVINGGIIEAYGTNTRMGKGNWMVAEADESDGSFLRLPAVVAVVTNMDPEHLDHWGSAEAMEAGYDQFVSNLPFYGFAVLCIDHPNVQKMIPRLSDRRIITYGFSPNADIQGQNIKADTYGCTFDVIVKPRDGSSPRNIGPLHLNMLGKHNVLNALAAVTVAMEMDIDPTVLQKSFEKFKGVQRRFTRIGNWNGAEIIDDYAHHPIEIQAVLEAAEQAGAKRIITVIQPHRYSRLKELFNDFCACLMKSDIVMISDVYAAGETPIKGAGRDELAEALKTQGHRHVITFSSQEELPALIAKEAQEGDYIMCLGAGTITKWAHDLPNQLKHLASK